MISSSEAVRDFGGLLDRTRKAPFFILRHNKPEAVMLGIEQYETMQAQLVELQDMLDHVLLYVELKTRGQESGEEITLDELAAKYEL
jgi:prevent-host-death family protein